MNSQPRGKKARNRRATPPRASRASRPTDGQGTRRPIIGLAGLIIFVAVIVSAAHWPVLSSEAISIDDDQYLTDNDLVQNPSWASVRRFLAEIRNPSTVEGYYQPLAMISLMLDSAAGGRPENLGPYRRTSLGLHVLNAVLVLMLLYLLFENTLAAVVGALLFGVHPITVEPVAWISDRKTLLATFFALWSLILYVRYAKTHNGALYGLALVTYLLALLSKPTTTPLPLLLLILDFWPLQKVGRRQILDKLPFVAIGALSASVTLVGQGRIGGVVLPATSSILQIPLKVCYNTVFYLYKLCWPVNMSSYYPAPEPFAASNNLVLAGTMVGCLLFAAILVSLRWTRSVAAGFLFFFVAIAPTLGVVGFAVVNASDKYAYLPMVGFLLVLVHLLQRYWRKPLQRPGSRRTSIGLLALLILVVGTQVVATRRTVAHWRDTDTLFRYMIRTSARPWQPHTGLANHLVAQGRIEEAIHHYQEGIRLEPGDFEAVSNLARALGKARRFDEAIAQHERALRMQPDNARLHANLAFDLAQKGDLEDSIHHYLESVRLDPDCPDAHFNLALTLMRAGRIDEAIHYYEETLRISPTYFQAHVNLGHLLWQQGRLDEAIDTYQRALAISPGQPNVRFALALTLESRGRTAEAVEQYRQVLRQVPDHTEARERLRALVPGE